MRVLFLTKTGRIGASARYLVYQYLAYQKKNGVDCVVVPAVDDSIVARYVADPKGRSFATTRASSGVGSGISSGGAHAAHFGGSAGNDVPADRFAAPQWRHVT